MKRYTIEVIKQDRGGSMCGAVVVRDGKRSRALDGGAGTLQSPRRGEETARHERHA